jgi:hypothetical protein
MKIDTIREYEAWTKPGTVMSPDYGKELEKKLKELDAFKKLGIPEGVFVGISNIPSDIDMLNLKNGLKSGEYQEADFIAFCHTNGLKETVESKESACKFIEYKDGREVAWLNVPADDEENILPRLSELIQTCNLIIIDPDTGKEVLV